MNEDEIKPGDAIFYEPPQETENAKLARTIAYVLVDTLKLLNATPTSIQQHNPDGTEAAENLRKSCETILSGKF